MAVTVWRAFEPFAGIGCEDEDEDSGRDDEEIGEDGAGFHRAPRLTRTTLSLANSWRAFCVGPRPSKTSYSRWPTGSPLRNEVTRQGASEETSRDRKRR